MKAANSTIASPCCSLLDRNQQKDRKLEQILLSGVWNLYAASNNYLRYAIEADLMWLLHQSTGCSSGKEHWMVYCQTMRWVAVVDQSHLRWKRSWVFTFKIACPKFLLKKNRKKIWYCLKINLVNTVSSPLNS